MFYPSQIPKPLIAAAPGWTFRPLIALFSVPADASGWRVVSTARVAALGNCSPKTARNALKALVGQGLLERDGDAFQVAEGYRSTAYVSVPPSLTATNLNGGILRAFAFTLGFRNRASGRCNPSQATLARTLFPGSKCGPRTVRRYHAALREAGFLEWDTDIATKGSAGPGRGHSNRYRFPHLDRQVEVGPTVDLRDTRVPDASRPDSDTMQPDTPRRGTQPRIQRPQTTNPFADLRKTGGVTVVEIDAPEAAPVVDDERVGSVLEAGMDARQTIGLPRTYPHEAAEVATIERLLEAWDWRRLRVIYTHLPRLSRESQYWASKTSGASLAGLRAQDVEEIWTKAMAKRPGTLLADMPQDPCGWGDV